jgi:hypothetical protein
MNDHDFTTVFTVEQTDKKPSPRSPTFVAGGQKKSKVAPMNPMRSSSIGTRTCIVAGSR